MPADNFCMIPARAFGDQRLSASHHRLLLVIAWHDRDSISQGRRGCYAAQATLANETGIHATNIGRIAEELALWGYISAERNPKDRRSRTYRVIYNDNQATVGQSTNDQRGDAAPADGHAPIVGQSTNDPEPTFGHSGPTLGEPPQEVTDLERISRPNIFPERGRDTAKQEIHLVETRSANGSKPRRPLQWGEQLDRLQRIFRTTTLEHLSEMLMSADEHEQTKLGDASTSDDDIAKIMQRIADRHQNRAAS